MALEAIPTEVMKLRLRNLRWHLPNQDDTVYQLGNYLADRLNGADELLPVGLNMIVELGFYDLRKGINGFTGEPIRSGLAGCPPQLYAVLKEFSVQSIVEVVCPEDFAKEFKEIREEVKRM